MMAHRYPSDIKEPKGCRVLCFGLLRRGDIAAIAMLPALLTAGCLAGYKVDPDRTTYPRDLIRQEQVKMSVLPQELGGGVGIQAGSFSHTSAMQGRPFLEWEQTVTGDSALHEVRIVPNQGSPWYEASLRARVPDLARQICGPRYRINLMKYYIGTEGTSKFLGIAHPWLAAEIRCPLNLRMKEDSPATDLLESVSKTILEADFFDIHQKDYPIGVTQLRAVIEKVLTARGMSITQSFQSSGMDVIVTDNHRSGIIGFPVYQQIIAVLAQKNNGSVLTTRLLAYYQDFEGRSDATGILRLIPTRRNFAYQHLQNFLGEIEKAVESR